MPITSQDVPPHPEHPLRPGADKLFKAFAALMGVSLAAAFLLLLTNPADLIWAWLVMGGVAALLGAALTTLFGKLPEDHKDRRT